MPNSSIPRMSSPRPEKRPKTSRFPWLEILIIGAGAVAAFFFVPL